MDKENNTTNTEVTAPPDAAAAEQGNTTTPAQPVNWTSMFNNGMVMGIGGAIAGILLTGASGAAGLLIAVASGLVTAFVGPKILQKISPAESKLTLAQIDANNDRILSEDEIEKIAGKDKETLKTILKQQGATFDGQHFNYTDADAHKAFDYAPPPVPAVSPEKTPDQPAKH